MSKEIKCLDPFFAEFNSSYDGYTSYTFTCPFCGGHSVKRCKGSEGNMYFFEGHFRCKTCCKGSYQGQPFCYYSSCFIRQREAVVTQLSLFD